MAGVLERRSQAERRAETRGKLLDGAIQCLVERGYAATTTQDIARTAGVSQGAIFKHYPTKSALMIAATEHLYARLRGDFPHELARVAHTGGDRVGAALDILWDVFQSPEVLASFELHVAARTDPELRAALEPMAAAHQQGILALARDLFPEATAATPRFDTYIDLVLSVMQGSVIGGLARTGRVDHGPLRDELERLARGLLVASEGGQ